MEALWKFFKSLFADHSSTNTFNYMASVFWLVVGPLMGWGTATICYAICYAVCGVPVKRAERKGIMLRLKAMQHTGKN